VLVFNHSEFRLAYAQSHLSQRKTALKIEHADSDPKSAPATRAGRARWTRIAVNAFIIFHLIAILAWALPFNTLVIGKTKELISPYMLWSGLFQAWDLFAPDPRSINVYVDAEIILRDGQQRTWTFPRMEELGTVDKYFKERYRKWANDNLRMDSYSALWPDAARYVARLNADKANPPRTVKLTRHWSTIVPPDAHQGDAAWQQYTFYTYEVKPDDLL
jgi:hypothetical protein